MYCYCCLVAYSCLTFCNLMDCSLTGSSVHGISQARIPAWVSITFSRESSWHMDQTHVSCITGQFFTTEPSGKSHTYTHNKLCKIKIKMFFIFILIVTHSDALYSFLKIQSFMRYHSSWSQRSSYNISHRAGLWHIFSRFYKSEIVSILP